MANKLKIPDAILAQFLGFVLPPPQTVGSLYEIQIKASLGILIIFRSTLFFTVEFSVRLTRTCMMVKVLRASVNIKEKLSEH